MAAMGMSSSSAAQTAAEPRWSERTASRGRRYSATRRAVSAGDADAWARTNPSTSRGRPSHVPPRTIQSKSRSWPGVTARVGLPADTRRAGCARRRRSRWVDALAPAGRDGLVGERLDRLRGVPAPDGAAQRTAPAAEPVDEGRELEQVRGRPRDPRECVERGPARVGVPEAGRHRQAEERRVVARRPARVADADDLGDGPPAVRADAALERLRVRARGRPFGREVAAVLGAEDEEAAQPRPVVDRPGMAPGAPGGLPGARDRDLLGHVSRAVTLQMGHVDTSLPGSGRVGRGAAVVACAPANRRRFGPRRGMGRLLRSWRHGPAALCRLSYRSTRSPSGTRTRDHLEDVENRAVPARSSHVSSRSGRQDSNLRSPASGAGGVPLPHGQSWPCFPLRDVCAARPPFGPGPPRRARRPTWRGAGARIAPCYCRKMTAGAIAAVIALPKSPTTRRRSLSLSGGASDLSLWLVRVGHHLAADGAVSRGCGFGQQKGRPSGSPSRVPDSLRPCG